MRLCTNNILVNYCLLTQTSSIRWFKCLLYELDATVDHSFETKYYAFSSIPRFTDMPQRADMPHFPLHINDRFPAATNVHRTYEATPRRRLHPGPGGGYCHTKAVGVCHQSPMEHMEREREIKKYRVTKRFNKICYPSQRHRWQVDKEAIGLSRVQQCSSTYNPPS